MKIKLLRYFLIALVVVFAINFMNKDKDKTVLRTTPIASMKNNKTVGSVKNVAPTNDIVQSPGAVATSIIIGVEYGFDRIANFFSGLGIPAAKLLPEKFDWAKMQSDITKPINWTLSDNLIREYQNAGFKEIIMGLRAQSHDSDNGATYGKKRPVPKPEYRNLYVDWIEGMVERYDKDGINDMLGLKYPIHYYEIEVEFTSYTPETVDEYIDKLGIAYKAAHKAFSDVIVAHSAFLPMTSFDNNPTEKQYETAFASMRIPDKTHNLADIRKVLDHPELFDRVNFHALEDPIMLERAIKWLNYEMNRRGYKKPIIVSDTSPTPFISYGNATTCKGGIFGMGIMVWPAKESDRCRTADYFNKILNNDATTFVWKNIYIAADTVKRVVIAAQWGAELIDTAFVTDLPILSTKLGMAGGGNGGFGGFITDNYNIFTQKHIVSEYRPVYYAVKQLARLFSGNFTIIRENSDADIRLYKIQNSNGTSWIGWVSPDYLILPGDAEPQKQIFLPLASGAIITKMAIKSTSSEKTNVSSVLGQVKIDLTTIPVYIVGD